MNEQASQDIVKRYSMTIIKERDELRGRLAEFKKQDEERGCI